MSQSHGAGAADQKSIQRSLEEAVGADHVSRRLVDRFYSGHDAWSRRIYQPLLGLSKDLETEAKKPPPLDGDVGLPRWVVWPGAAAEVAHVVRVANLHGLRIVPYGGGTSLSGGAGGPHERPTVVVDTKRMSQILDIDETSNVLHVQAGILGQELEVRLARRGLFLGHLPGSFYFSSLGGWLATRSAGELLGRMGRVDELCVGLTAVLPSGALVHTRVVPRKSTGPDFKHLLLGAEGRLGIITAAHLRVSRRFESRLWEAALFQTPAGALGALAAVFREDVRPTVARVLGETATQRVFGREGFGVVLGFGGPEPVVSAERGVARGCVEAAGGEILKEDLALEWWRTRHRAPYEVLRRRVRSGSVADEVDASAPWSALAPVGAAMCRALEALGARTELEWGPFTLEGGGVTVRFTLSNEEGRGSENGIERGGEDSRERLDEAWEAALRACRARGGGEIHHRGVGQMKGAFLEEPRWELFAKIQEALDPKGVFRDLP